MKTITTERLVLRPHTMDDVHASYEMNLDPSVSRYTHDGGVVSLEEIERRIREDVLGDYSKHGYGRFAVTLKDTGEFIGFCSIKYLEDYKLNDLGYRLKHDYWGNGYATEASKASLEYGFNTLDLTEIFAFVLPKNERSIRVLDKLGFKKCGKVFEDGAWAEKYIIEHSDT